MDYPIAVKAIDAPPRVKLSNYPEPFASRMNGRTKRPLGDLFGLSNFGVNLTTLAPGAVSALQHRHTLQDEFVYVVQGEAVLVTGDAETVLTAGMCAGFKAGGVSHHLENRSDAPALYLEIGDRTKGDEATYPADDLLAVAGPNGWIFAHKDGSPY
ncbi:cupin domain-containing protein [Microvirga sp. 2YAF29]|uniref:cupin domain-containing protein n=1 Tax=Microvirga sp. 2YAF29 TaxID=3233031 RepID=UPI003F962173